MEGKGDVKKWTYFFNSDNIHTLSHLYSTLSVIVCNTHPEHFYQI